MRRRFAGTCNVSGRRILALTTDSFGGHGGIATYARDTIRAMAARDDVDEVLVPLLLRPDPLGELPPKVRIVDCSKSGKVDYVGRVTLATLPRGFDAVWASHVQLAPVALAAARRSGARFGVSLHGSEVWQYGRCVTEWAMKRADLLMPVSQVTMDRFRALRSEREQAYAILPGAVDLAAFRPGPKPPELIERYGLEGRRVALTVARIAPDFEKKGFMRMVALMPSLIERWPDLVYVIAGSGAAQPILEQLIRSHGLGDRVIVTGYIPPAELADHYRMADLFILPSTGEGLGIVLLEAQACGVPTIASKIDGGAEAVAGMGWTVDPFDPASIEQAIAEVLDAPMGRPAGLERFGRVAFDERMNAAVDRLFAGRTTKTGKALENKR